MGDRRQIRRFWFRLGLALLFFGSFTAAEAQNALYIFKPGKKTRYEYRVGDYIAIRPKQNFPTLRGNIYQISDSCIYFSFNDSIRIDAIDAVLVHEDPRVFSKGYWWKTMAVTAGGIGIWQIMYLVNAGELSPDVKSAPYIIAFTGFIPLTINGVYKLFVRQETKIGPEDWRIGTIVLK